MKKSAGSLFLVLYMVAMLRPIQPIVEYYLQYDYFSKVLCLNKTRPELKCNGQCILMQRLKKAAQESQPEPFAPAPSNFSLKDYPLALLSVKNASEQMVDKQQLAFTHYQGGHESLWIAEIFHPPA